MHTSLILAVTFVPLVLFLVLLGLILAWLHMRHVNHADVVDLVELQKEPQLPLQFNDFNSNGRRSTEPFPQLPSMDLQDAGGLLSTSDTAKPLMSYGNLQYRTHSPVTGPGRTPSNTLATPPKRPTSLTESPSSEALAAFDFSDSPSKPPVPTRSLKRSSRSTDTPFPVTPTIKIEPASPSNASEADGKIYPPPFEMPRLSPPIPRRVDKEPARATSAVSCPSNDLSYNFQSNLSLSIPASIKHEVDDKEAIKRMPFSAVPIAHIGSPISDNLPPTPVLAGKALPFLPKDEEGMKAMKANREMMEMEGWRPDREAALMQKSPGKSMIGKRNSAIREYVRNFPEQNPWRKMMGHNRKSKDLEAQALSDEDFKAKFGGGKWE